MKNNHRPPDSFSEVTRDSLADTLARRIRGMIQRGEYDEGDRLPAILEMARRFGVGPPTVREALKKLETLGVVDVRHGSGVYVASRRELLVLARPQLGGAVGDRLLSDLIEARIPLEVEAARTAALHASDEELAGMRHLLERVAGLADTQRCIAADGAFHRQLAVASGNTIVAQLLDALRDLFTGDGNVVGWEPLVCDADVSEHLGILDALEHHDALAATERMRVHLERVREAVAAARGAQRTA
jgi:GntR family transcriptional repressor for pyruvate dehydrogenase complex